MKPYYITTPIYYVNALPHIGHAYTTIAADTAARYQREILKKEVFFITGTDENSQKNVEAAEVAGKDTKTFVDEMSMRWAEIWKDFHITNDTFMRTTSATHKAGVEKFFKKVWDKGLIYKGAYEGLYCVGCEAFYSESDIQGGECPVHKRKLEVLKEENYFFRLTHFKDELLEHIERHPTFITPEVRKNEIVSYIKNFMTDISISRQSMKWGIPVPTDATQVLYVWFDALINYLTGLGYGTDEEKYEKFWNGGEVVHVIGKDILKFHAALWPAMLMAADIRLPDRLIVQGYFTVDGEKMSKSIGNVINPVAAAERHGIEPLRYYLLSAIPYGNDGDVSMERFEELYTADLKNGIGNLVSRVISMVEQYCAARVPNKAPFKQIVPASELIGNAIENFAFHELVSRIRSAVHVVNDQINSEKPWELIKAGKQQEAESLLMYCLEQIHHIAWALYPIMPETANSIFQKLGLDAQKELSQDIDSIQALKPGSSVAKGDILFT